MLFLVVAPRSRRQRATKQVSYKVEDSEDDVELLDESFTIDDAESDFDPDFE